jgi:hypothetical protein
MMTSDLLTKTVSICTEQAFSSIYHLFMQRREGVNRTEVKVEYKLMSSIHQREGTEVIVVWGGCRWTGVALWGGGISCR